MASIVYLFVGRLMKQTAVIVEAYHFCQLRTKFYLTHWGQSSFRMQGKLLLNVSADFGITGQLLIIYFAFVNT